MTPKERVRAVFRGETPDRVPVFEQSVASTVASKILGREAHTGTGELHRAELEAAWKGEDEHAELASRLHRDTVDIIQALGFDIMRLPWRKDMKADAKPDEFTYVFGSPGDMGYLVLRYNPESRTVFAVDDALKRGGVGHIERLVEEEERSLKGAGAGSGRDYRWLRWIIEGFGAEYAVAGSHGISIPMREEWLVAIITHPALVERHLDVQCERGLRAIREEAELGVDFILGGGDLATNQGPIYSPAHFRRFVLPRLKRTCEFCNELGVPYVYRTDGVTWPIGEMLFEESGVAGYGEIDAQAGMDLAELKARFPGLVLWGNVDCGETLVRGTVEDVEAASRECLRKGMPGGRYIFGSSNSISWATPPENLLAMLRVAKEEGLYDRRQGRGPRGNDVRS